MKSFLILFFVLIFSTLSWGKPCRGNRCGNRSIPQGSCSTGSCQSNFPLFQSPFPNGTQNNETFDTRGFDTFNRTDALGGSSINNSANLGPTFNTVGAFNSLGGRVHDRGGFLFIGNNPIFIGDHGEVLVKDFTTGQLIPADFNTSSQVLGMYRDWALRVEAGECPNSRGFAIAQRALNSEFNQPGIAGGFEGGIAGGLNHNPNSPGHTLDDGLNHQPPTVVQPPQNPATSENSGPKTEPNSGKHAEPKSPLPSEKHPVDDSVPPANETSESLDQMKLQVFSDSQGHFFLMDPKAMGENIFIGDGKSFSRVSGTGFAGNRGSSFHLRFKDPRYTGVDESLSFDFADPRAEFKRSSVKDASDILFKDDKMTVRCGTHLTDYKEVKGDEALKLLKGAKISQSNKTPCEPFNP